MIQKKLIKFDKISAPGLWGLLLLGSLVVVGAAGVLMASAAGQDSPAEKLEVRQAAASHFAGEVTVKGMLVPGKSAALSAQVAGTVAFLAVQEGDQVKQGDILLEYDLRDGSAQAAAAAAKVAQAQSQIEQAQVNYANAQKDLERYRQLYEAGGVSQKQLETVEAACVSAQANYEMARSGAQLAQATMTSAEVNLDKMVVKSPIDGVVAVINPRLGENVTVGQPLVSVVATNYMELSGLVTEATARSLQEGMAGQVQVQTLPDSKLPARVIFVSPLSISGGDLFPIKLTVDNSGRRLRAGMEAVAVITVSADAPVAVARTAVFSEAGKEYIFRVINKQAVKTRVMTGLAGKNEIEILAGIQPGEDYLAQGVACTLDGDAIDLKD